MTNISHICDDIPGFLKAAFIFKGSTVAGRTVSAVWLKDDDKECLLDITEGMMSNVEGLTPRMRSYLTGMSEVGDYLESRKKVDEDDVTVDDIERAALALAFPKVARQEAAFEILKNHLDALQNHGIIKKISIKGSDAFQKVRSDAADKPRAYGDEPVSRPVVDAPKSTTPQSTPAKDSGPAKENAPVKETMSASPFAQNTMVTVDKGTGDKKD